MDQATQTRPVEDRVAALEAGVGALAQQVKAALERLPVASKAENVPADRQEHCDCARSFSRLDQGFHDWLVGFEERGVAGVVEIIQYLDADAESMPVAGTLRWSEFPQFVAMHSWRHPADVHDLANFVDESITKRMERWSAEEKSSK